MSQTTLPATTVWMRKSGSRSGTPEVITEVANPAVVTALFTNHAAITGAAEDLIE